MHTVYRRAKTGHNATVFPRMLYDHGGLETVRRLLAERGVSEGFTALWQAGRLDLTIEAQVPWPRARRVPNAVTATRYSASQ